MNQTTKEFEVFASDDLEAVASMLVEDAKVSLCTTAEEFDAEHPSESPAKYEVTVTVVKVA